MCARSKKGDWLQLTFDLLPNGRVALKKHLTTSYDETAQAQLAKDAGFRRQFLYNEWSSVFNGDPKLGKTGFLQRTGKIPLADFSHIVIMSDGAFDPKSKSPLDTCRRLENRHSLRFCPSAVADDIFREKEQARSTDLGGKAFDDLTLAVVTIPE